MKRIVTFILSLSIAFILVSCSSAGEGAVNPDQESENQRYSVVISGSESGILDYPANETAHYVSYDLEFGDVSCFEKFNNEVMFTCVCTVKFKPICDIKCDRAKLRYTISSSGVWSVSKSSGTCYLDKYGYATVTVFLTRSLPSDAVVFSPVNSEDVRISYNVISGELSIADS